MKKRIGAILLTVCMLLGLLPATALAEENGYQLTLNYDSTQCSVVVTDRNNKAEVKSGDYLTIGTYGAVMEVWVYVNDGYRIKSVSFTDKKGTEDLTEHYIVGAYGWDPYLYAYSDCTLTITTEAIPDELPTITDIALYSDEARTVAMSENVTLATGGRTNAYVKAAYEDGEEHPIYIARGKMEFSIDGETWLNAHHGDHEIDLTVNYCQYEDSIYQTGTEYPQYDYRFCVEPDNVYWSGTTVYSEVYHVNGGVNGDASGSGDSGSGDSGSGTIPECTHANTTTINAKNATCGDAGYTGDTWCNDCRTTIAYGTTISATGEHSWNDGEITTPPTVDSDGKKTFTCTGCGDTRTESVSKLKTQNVSWTVSSVTWMYGKVGQVNNDAYNDTENGGALTYSSSNTEVATVNENGRVTIVGAGTASITATAAAVADYAETSASYTLIVNKASLTVTANNKTIAYGEAPAHDGYVVDGLVNGEDASVLTGAPVYGYTYEQYGNAGTYAINVSGLTAKNYEITFEPGTLTVEKATAYTVTLGKLEQVAGHTSAVTASISPVDSTAVLKVEYQVSGQWTETVPDDPGSYAVRISLTDSDNIALDDTFTTDTLVVKNGVTVDGANVDAAVTVENGKAALTIEDPAEVAGNASGDVSIDLGGISGAEELELPAALLTGLSENENTDSLTVATEDASVKLSGEVLDTVAEAVTSSEDAVTLRLTAVEKNDLNDKQQAALDSIGQDAVIVEVSLVVTHTDGSETELHELGGSAEITVPYAGTVPEGKYIVVSYVSSDGSVSYVRATYNRETGQVSFKTDHFSHYALFLSSRNTYRVNVIHGSGSGTYLEGSTVTVRADSRSGDTFSRWEVVSGAVTLANANDSQTTFIVPAGDVTLKAVYTENTVWPVLPAQPAQPVKPAAPVDPAQPSTPFADVPAGSYYASAVYWAVEQGLTTGLTATCFAPDGTCARAQLVTFLWRGSGCPAVDYAMGFSDVAEDEWYTEAVRWAASAGIVQGYDNGLFGTNDTVTREQMVTILYHYAQAMGMDVSIGADTNILSFRDALSVSEYAVEAMQWAVGADIVQGYSGELMPKSACTRAQIVTILYRLLGQK